ncbi:MAG: hypothetical protein AAGA91_14905 [Pseudomonadota bacterium]
MNLQRNVIIALVALLIPLIGEWVSPQTGLGVQILLYWPFGFAYALLVGFVFVATNLLAPSQRYRQQSLVIALTFWLGWFVVTYLSVTQLHLALGYTL